MKSYEHRAIGDAATDGVMVNLGAESPDDAFWITFGDVVALSGDYVAPSDRDGGLFALARSAGRGGTQVQTRDELVCALKVATIDEGAEDRRFDPGGAFGNYLFSPHADRSDVERAVRDRYLSLAAVNDDHFVSPGPSDVPTGTGYGSARLAYHHLHLVALNTAWVLARDGGDVSGAVAREAAAQHYLTDAFAAGHLRTPVASIRRYWKARHPEFWDRLQRRVASDTARTLRDLSVALRLLPPAYLLRRTHAELTTRTGRYPELSLGDLVARCLHDWDNSHGLELETGEVVFGDGSVDKGATTELAIAGVRAGIDDVEAAHALGAKGQCPHGEPLYEAVRQATGAAGDEFVAETMIPRPSASAPVQNWHAGDAASLWDTPLVGTTGTTVGGAIAEMLAPGGQFIRQLDALGQGLSGSSGLFGLPVIGGWLAGKCCQAFHDGFVERLAHDPSAVVFDLVREA